MSQNEGYLGVVLMMKWQCSAIISMLALFRFVIVPWSGFIVCLVCGCVSCYVDPGVVLTPVCISVVLI